MHVLSDPFFWATISMLGLIGAAAVVASRRLAQSKALGMLSVVLFALGRVVLVLPGLPQPRLPGTLWIQAVGGTLFIAGVLFTLPAIVIRPFTGPGSDVTLRDRGLYGLVRNPIYLGELLWSCGWAMMFRSMTGIGLVAVWWASLWLLTLIEEERLELALGQPYQEYRRRVRGRIIPGLPL